MYNCIVSAMLDIFVCVYVHYDTHPYMHVYNLSQKHSISYLAWILKWNDMKLVKGFVLNLFYQVWSREIELRKDMDKKTMASLTFFYFIFFGTGVSVAQDFTYTVLLNFVFFYWIISLDKNILTWSPPPNFKSNYGQLALYKANKSIFQLR